MTDVPDTPRNRVLTYTGSDALDEHQSPLERAAAKSSTVYAIICLFNSIE